MTYEEIFAKSKELVGKSDVSNMDGHLAVQINIEGEGSGAFYIELRDKQLFIEPYEFNDRDCKFTMSAKNFLKLAEGKMDAVVAFTLGKLKLEGSFEKALMFKKILDSANGK